MSNLPNIADPNLLELFFEHSYQTIFKDEKKLRRLILAHIKYLTPADVAYILGKSERTIQRWIKEGKLLMLVDEDGDRIISLEELRRQIDKIYKPQKR